MDGVRTVAGVFLIIGWIMLVIGGLAALAILGTIGSTAGGVFGAMIPLGMALAASLSPFFLWAILRALIEIYEIQSKTYAMLQSARDIEYSSLMTMQEATGIYDALERASARPPSAPQGPGGRPSAAPSDPTRGGLAAAAASAASSASARNSSEPVTCRGCNWRFAAGTQACPNCGVSL